MKSLSEVERKQVIMVVMVRLLQQEDNGDGQQLVHQSLVHLVIAGEYYMMVQILPDVDMDQIFLLP